MLSSQRRSRPAKLEQTDCPQSGFALIAVLLFLLVATAIITPMVLAARTDFLLSSRDYLNTRQSIVSESVLNIINWELASLGVEKNEALALNSEPMQMVCGDYAITIAIQDQAGLVDINAAPERLLQAGFQALGFSGNEASSLSKLAIAYREPKIGNTVPPRNADELTNGLKHFGFEAIEEIYEFPGFAKMPPGRLSQVFTVFTKQATINSRVMSPLLAEILPDEATAQFPFIVDQEVPLLFGEVRVLVENTDFNARGFSGAVIEVPDATAGIFSLKERSIDPGILGDENTFDANLECADVFGDQVASLLASS